jgi:hypothetical protein
MVLVRKPTKTLSITADSPQSQVAKPVPMNGTKPKLMKLSLKVMSTSELEAALAQYDLGTLSLVPGTLHKKKKYYLAIHATCSACNNTWEIHVSSIKSGATTNCRCQRGRKYGGDPRAEMLGRRYDCIVQRCTRDTHKQSKDYKGKGIKCLFKSREHFVKWALAKWPDTDFEGLEFDRIDNAGHYEPGNLRLTTSRENHMNRDDAIMITFQGQTMHWSKWNSPYEPQTTKWLASSGLSGEDIIARAHEAVAKKRKRWKVIQKRIQSMT